MSKNLKDILSNLNKDTEQNKLLEYLHGQLSEEEQHRVEENMNDDDFLSDAMDGLNEMTNKQSLGNAVKQLNTGLKKQIEKRKKKKNKRKFPSQTWAYYTIIILLILVIIAYVVIKKYKV